MYYLEKWLGVPIIDKKNAFRKIFDPLCHLAPKSKSAVNIKTTNIKGQLMHEMKHPYCIESLNIEIC